MVAIILAIYIIATQFKMQAIFVCTCKSISLKDSELYYIVMRRVYSRVASNFVTGIIYRIAGNF